MTLDAEVAELINMATIMNLDKAGQYLLSVYFENDSDHFLRSVREAANTPPTRLT